MTSAQRRLRPALTASLVCLLVGVLVGVLPAGPARAVTSCPHPSLRAQIKAADVVFRGVVTKVGPAYGSGHRRARTYQVRADRVYKASLVTDAVRVTSMTGVACPPPALARHRRYIFFVTEHGSRLVSTAATAKATTALTRQVTKRLGDGAQPHPRPTRATFARVADASPASLTRVLAPGAALLILSVLGLVVLGRLGRRPA